MAYHAPPWKHFSGMHIYTVCPCGCASGMRTVHGVVNQLSYAMAPHCLHLLLAGEVMIATTMGYIPKTHVLYSPDGGPCASSLDRRSAECVALVEVL